MKSFNIVAFVKLFQKGKSELGSPGTSLTAPKEASSLRSWPRLHRTINF